MSKAPASKRYRSGVQLVDRKKRYKIKEAVTLLKQFPATKFDETVEISVMLGLDPKKTDQVVRGTVTLPHGTGKTMRVAAFCQGEQVNQALEAGAEVAGGNELVAKVNGGWLDFDVAVATPAMMRELTKVGKILGPRGLMPSPKAGTVTEDIVKAIGEVKRGKIEFKQDKQAGLHIIVGKRSFPEQSLVENVRTMCEAIAHARPNSLKGDFLRSATIASTMSPGIPLDLGELSTGESD